LHIHYLQHVPFEDLGSLEAALLGMGHTIGCTRLYADDPLPTIDDFDALIVMGGPMGVHDEPLYPWLGDEKALLRSVIGDTRKPLLGICLGAQLIATVLGTEVRRNPHREIGWFPLQLDPAFIASRWGDCLADGTFAFHWHGDTFTMPQGSLPIGSSEACLTQGYILDGRIIGLQFHLETTANSAKALISECADELDDSPFVQSAETIMAHSEHFTRINTSAAALVKQWLSGDSEP